MRTVFLTGIAILLASVVAGCGSDGAAGGSTTLAPTTAASYCEDVCDRDVACDPQVNEANCIGDCMEAGATLRGSVFVEMSSCLADLACGASDALCEPDDVAPLPIHDRYQADCEVALANCGEEQDVIDDLCGLDNNSEMAETLPLLATNVTQGLLDCLAMDCADTPDCIDDVADL